MAFNTRSLLVVVERFLNMQRIRRHGAEPDDAPASDEVVLLGEIRDLARDRGGRPVG